VFGKGLLKGLGITAKHTFEREITQQYPEEQPFLQDRYRGSLAYDYPKCIACGLCVKACPNKVLTLETYKDESSRKKKVASYVIDLQYCLFCNLCVEICPTDTLYFTHEFELTTDNREGIKKVYHRPSELELVPAQREAAGPQDTIPAPPEAAEPQEAQPAPPADQADDKRLRQVEAMKTALIKNPVKTLGKILPAEEDMVIMADLMKADENILAKLAQLLVEDRDKAAKVAAAWVKKGRAASPPPADPPPDAGADTDTAAAHPSPVEMTPPAAKVPGEESRGVSPPAAAELSEAEAKLMKQVEAMKTALAKNPGKILAKILPAEEDAAIMTVLLNQDEKIHAKLAQLLVEDRDKAAKVAAAWVTREKKNRPGEGGETL